MATSPFVAERLAPEGGQDHKVAVVAAGDHTLAAQRADQSPTLRRRRLGSELRRLREAAGLMIEDVGKHLECSGSKVSRIETGKGYVRLRDVRDMLDLYDLEEGPERELLLTLAREGQ